jgi:hypothetical protein
MTVPNKTFWWKWNDINDTQFNCIARVSVIEHLQVITTSCINYFYFTFLSTTRHIALNNLGTSNLWLHPIQ